MSDQTMQHRESAARISPVVSATAGRAMAVFGFAALTALGARLSVPLPGNVVPFTLQPVAVLLAGVMLGSRGGAVSQVVYLTAGMSGLPVFAAGGGALYLLGPTGGYLLAFPAAAWVAGRFCRPQASLPRWAVGLLIALGIVHVAGLSWLAVVGGTEAALAVGVTPFLAGDALKIVLVVLVGRAGSRLVQRSAGSGQRRKG